MKNIFQKRIINKTKKLVMHSFCAAWNQLSHGLVRVRDPGLRDHNLTLIHYGGLKSIQS